VLNVSEAPSVIRVEDYDFAAIADYPLMDFTLIPVDAAIACVDALHRMLTPPASKAYVHCIAGQNRSATVIWLYLIARGLTRAAATELVEQAARDAVPGHRSLVNERLASHIEDYGRRSLAPLSDLNAI
jgi:protein-tyrosine phosphatase